MNDRTTFDTATRIAAGDDGTNYDGVAITLHWTTALLVIVQFVSAITWDYFSRATRGAMESLHVSLGVILAVVIIARLIWRLIPGHELSALEVGWVGNASKAVHYLLYLLLVAQVVSGFVFRWAQGHPVEFFGIFGIPGPLDAVGRPTRHLIHDVHEYLGWSIVIIAFVMR